MAAFSASIGKDRKEDDDDGSIRDTQEKKNLLPFPSLPLPHSSRDQLSVSGIGERRTSSLTQFSIFVNWREEEEEEISTRGSRKIPGHLIDNYSTIIESRGEGRILRSFVTLYSEFPRV